MTLPKLTMARAMILIVFLAANFALIRHSVVGYGPSRLVAWGVILMADVLAIGLHRLLARPGSRSPFFVGFLFHGLAAVVAYVAFFQAFPTLAGPYHQTLLDPISRLSSRVFRTMQALLGEQFGADSAHGRATIVLIYVLTIPSGAILLSLPPLAFALFGGLMSRSIDRVTATARAGGGRVGAWSTPPSSGSRRD